jgi:hypothetical protein
MYGDKEAEIVKYQLFEEEWELTEILLLFLLPFKRCSDCFKCNNTYTEIDYVFFAYDTLFNHIDDVKDRLTSDVSLGSLSCAPFILTAVEKMRLLLVKYYERMEVPSVYIDEMILNPRMKMIIFEEDSWSDINAAEYQAQSRQQFQVEYELSSTTDTGTTTFSESSSVNNRKRSASNYFNN